MLFAHTAYLLHMSFAHTAYLVLMNCFENPTHRACLVLMICFENSLHTACLLHISCFQNVFPGAPISIIHLYHQRNSSYPEQSYLSNISASSPLVTKHDCYPPSKQIKTLKSLHITSHYTFVLMHT